MTTSNDVRFLYLRDSSSTRVVTVARQIYKTDPNGTRWVEFAFCVNRPVTKAGKMVLRQGDSFNKAIGRRIAAGRLAAGHSMLTHTQPGEGPIEAVLRFLSTCEASFKVPQTVRRMAREALSEAMGTPRSTYQDTSLSTSDTVRGFDF